MVSGYDPGWLQMFESVARSEIAGGNQVVIWDITPIAAMPVDSYHRRTMKMFRIPFPGHDIEQRMTALDVRYVRESAQGSEEDNSPLDDQTEELLAVAVQSALITYFRTDQPNLRSALVARSRQGLVDEGRRVYRAAVRLQTNYRDIATAYVPNGRFPSQKAAAIAFGNAGIRTLHIERGDSAGRMYLQDYAPQERVRSQDSAEHVLAGQSPAHIDEIADAWMQKRAPSKQSHNEFSALWDQTLPQPIVDSVAKGKKVIGFFTSSQDEFEFLGPEWRLHTWKSQFEAFDLLMTRFESDGYLCYLRVHPNLATKSDDCFKREREGVRELARNHPNLEVIWHDNPTSTYALLDASSAIVVWYSTVGLEASARGLPVWSTATSRYGRVADVRELLSPETAEADTGPWIVDPHGAKRYIAYLVLRDQDISPDVSSWTDWDPARPPLGVRLAAAAASGGIPTAGAAIRSLVDVYRHRGLRANLKALHR